MGTYGRCAIECQAVRHNVYTLRHLPYTQQFVLAGRPASLHSAKRRRRLFDWTPVLATGHALHQKIYVAARETRQEGVVRKFAVVCLRRMEAFICSTVATKS